MNRYATLVADIQRLAKEMETRPEAICDLEPIVTELYDQFASSGDQLPDDGAYMTREEDQLLRESDERASFNDQLDNLRLER